MPSSPAHTTAMEALHFQNPQYFILSARATGSAALHDAGGKIIAAGVSRAAHACAEPLARKAACHTCSALTLVVGSRLDSRRRCCTASPSMSAYATLSPGGLGASTPLNTGWKICWAPENLHHHHRNIVVLQIREIMHASSVVGAQRTSMHLCTGCPCKAKIGVADHKTHPPKPNAGAFCCDPVWARS